MIRLLLYLNYIWIETYLSIFEFKFYNFLLIFNITTTIKAQMDDIPKQRGIYSEILTTEDNENLKVSIAFETNGMAGVAWFMVHTELIFNR